MRLVLVAVLLAPFLFVRWSVIPHASQDYDTCGNWKWDGWRLRVTASALSDRRYEVLVLVHETIEAVLCGVSGVSEAAVTEFDVAYESHRTDILRDKNPFTILAGVEITATSEPGDNPHACYHRQHRIATAVERGLAFALLVNWSKYEREVESL